MGSVAHAAPMNDKGLLDRARDEQSLPENRVVKPLHNHGHDARRERGFEAAGLLRMHKMQQALTTEWTLSASA